MKLSDLVRELQRIRFALDGIEDCVDDFDMMGLAQELSCDLSSLEDSVCEGIESEC